MQETVAGTFAQNSRDSHYLVYHGCKPTMEQATLPTPDTFYSRRPNPRVKTNAANRSNFSLGDERDWGFETLNEMQYKIPTKIPPRHASILPNGPNSTKTELDAAYVVSLNKIGVAGVKRLELAIRAKIDQRTAGGPMALRKAFKFFDTDGSGDIDPDEFYAAMHAFGLEFTEDQVLALFGYYDVDRDGALSYYEFIDKVLESGFGLDDGKEKPPPVLVALGPSIADEPKEVEVRTVLRKQDLDESVCREIFDRFDANKSGEIDVRELQQLTRALGLSMDREAINNAMFELDRNRNGAISFEEFWSWWQSFATQNGARAAPRTGGGNDGSRPKLQRPQSEQGMRSLGGRPSSGGSGISRPGSQHSQLLDLKSALINEADKARPSSRGSQMGSWFSQGGGLNGGNGNLIGRPNTRNFQRSVAGQDFSPPPALSRPPKLHGLRSRSAMSMSRPHTAPDSQTQSLSGFVSDHVRVPGAPQFPHGACTGYVL